MVVLSSMVPVHGFTALVHGTSPMVSLVQGKGSVVSLIEGAGPVLHPVGSQFLHVALRLHAAAPVLRCTGPVQEAAGVAADQDRHRRGLGCQSVAGGTQRVVCQMMDEDKCAAVM